MTRPSESPLERLRRPEYTGESRCLPCTVVNVGIALVASAVLALLSTPLGLVAFLSSLVAIYLRGYLVPGTPTLTERYLPDRVLASFDAHPAERREETWETVDRLERRRQSAVDPERFLLDVGAVEPCEHEEDLCLTDAFARRLDERIGELDADRIDRDALARAFDTDHGSITVLEREHPAVRIGRRVRKWPSEAALVADLAGDRALRERTDRWVGVPLVQRLGMLKSLRSFHDVCPRCSGAIRLSEGTVESCCRSYEVIAIGCADCGASLLEFNPNDVELRGDETGVQP
jgi:hypothetical protein